MKLTISFPDRIATRLRHLPNPGEFVCQAVEKALDQEQRPSEPLDAEALRWARIVQRVESESISLGDYYPQFKKDLNKALRD